MPGSGREGKKLENNGKLKKSEKKDKAPQR